MARIRTIKPSFFRHRELYDLEVSRALPLRVAFAGLWTASDREGRFRWRPDELKLDCLPFDPVDFGDVLDALAAGDFIRRYEAGGRLYGWIPGWSHHQSINQRETASVLPAPGECTHMPARGEGKGREQEGKGTEISPEPPHAATSGPALGAQAGIDRRADDDAATVLLFPIVGPKGPEWRLRRQQVEEWQQVYPNVDVLAECRRALSWVRANLGRRKTHKGMPQFLNGWLGRTVDRRSNGHSIQSPGYGKTAGNAAALGRFVNRGHPNERG